MDTKRRILDVARRSFNERGLARVGIREIARALEMSPGNLAYHFATKDALVAALLLELHQSNQKALFASLPADFSLVTLYEVARASMRAVLRYRFVLLGYPDAVEASPELAALERRLSARRRKRYEEMVGLLATNGYVDGPAVKRRLGRLAEQGEMIASGWLVAAKMRPELRSDEAIIAHYAKLGLALFEPHTTEKGARQMRRLLAGELD